jgi:hypothetical protein
MDNRRRLRARPGPVYRRARRIVGALPLRPQPANHLGRQLGQEAAGQRVLHLPVNHPTTPALASTAVRSSQDRQSNPGSDPNRWRSRYRISQRGAALAHHMRPTPSPAGLGPPRQQAGHQFLPPPAHRHPENPICTVADVPEQDLAAAQNGGSPRGYHGSPCRRLHGSLGYSPAAS